jgi:uncharacterized protein (TIGR03435 family)
MKHTRTVLLCIAATVSGGLTILSAQAALKFEVASIRLLTGNGAAGPVAAGGATRPGNYFTHAGSIRLLVQQAYGTPFYQQIGGPDWIREDTYLINALVPDGVERTAENMRVMVRALLEDRFKLVVREEQREVPIYALVLVKADKALGPKLRPFPADQCRATPADPECRSAMSSMRGTLRGRNAPFERFAPWLEHSVARPVVDRTGLTGPYNWDVSYAEDAAAGASDLPSFFTALEEQLGLKLEAQRARMPVVVIDSIERPTEN